jgi:hypothetical protein
MRRVRSVGKFENRRVFRVLLRVIGPIPGQYLWQRRAVPGALRPLARIRPSVSPFIPRPLVRVRFPSSALRFLAVASCAAFPVSVKRRPASSTAEDPVRIVRLYSANSGRYTKVTACCAVSLGAADTMCERSFAAARRTRERSFEAFAPQALSLSSPLAGDLKRHRQSLLESRVRGGRLARTLRLAPAGRRLPCAEWSGSWE